MPQAVIIDAIRTPIANLNGALKDVRPDDLAALVIRAIVERNQLDAELLEEVILGCANQAGEDNRNVARMASLLAGLPPKVPGMTVNRLCASGLSAVNTAVRAIKAGEGLAFIAGGVESMSRAPYAMPKTNASGNLTAYDTALGWRFVNPRMQALYGTDAMGQTAENIAEMLGISRAEQDAFALHSNQRAVAAQDEGRFKGEILPVNLPQRKGPDLLFEVDERPRRDTSLEALGRLKAAFKEGGSVTAGNSSGLNDGAAALLIMEEEAALKLGHKPLARVLSGAASGIEPRIMGLGPVEASRKALSRAGIGVQDLSLVELNEAFAVQALGVIRELGLDEAIVNVNGGAVALGHPLGCSGARILTTLVHEMQRRAPSASKPCYGLASLCVGVGQGEALVIEALC